MNVTRKVVDYLESMMGTGFDSSQPVAVFRSARDESWFSVAWKEAGEGDDMYAVHSGREFPDEEPDTVTLFEGDYRLHYDDAIARALGRAGELILQVEHRINSLRV